MFSFDPSPMNMILTVTVVVLFAFFIILLIKLKPSSERKENENLEPEIEVETVKGFNIPPDVPKTSQTSKIDAPRVSEKPLVAVSPTVGGSVVQTKQDIPPPAFESREVPKPEKTVAPMKTNSVSSKRDCIHHFGYLRSFPKNSPIPDECFGCEKIVDCLVSKKSK